jgi:hypothetical protein
MEKGGHFAMLIAVAAKRPGKDLLHQLLRVFKLSIQLSHLLISFRHFL